MKVNLLFFLFFLSIRIVNGQIVSSSCTATDSIISKYREDADRLALRKIYDHDLGYMDSIFIPRNISDTFLNALIAVYNATGLPERDTIIDLLDIRSFPDYVMNRINLSADSALSWMHELHNGNFPTGSQAPDSLLIAYHFDLEEYNIHFNYWPYHTATFRSDSNYNILPFATLFKQIPGMFFAEPVIISFFAKNDITQYSTFPEDGTISLLYYYALTEVSGRGWVFKFYPDGCFIELVGSFGSHITATHEAGNSMISIWPNPFEETISIDGLSGPFDFSIVSLAGQELMHGKSESNHIDHLEFLLPGMYILTVISDNLTFSSKILKE